MGDSVRIVDLGPVAVIYADGIASVLVSEPNVRIVFFEYREVDGERVRCPVVEIIRPLASYEPGLIRRLIAERRADEVVPLAVH